MSGRIHKNVVKGEKTVKGIINVRNVTVAGGRNTAVSFKIGIV